MTPQQMDPRLERPRLEQRLDQALTHRLTVIVADSGFGKTTLLDEWSRGINAVWHSVIEPDRDVGVLVRAVLESLRLRVPDLAPGVAAALAAAQGAAASASDGRARALASRVGAALDERLARDLVLVVDDVHLLDPAGPSAQFLGHLMRNAPPLLHLVLSSRDDPPFTIERLREGGAVLDVDGADLAFTPDEVQQLVDASLPGQTAGLGVEIHGVTGGWPAAVRLSVEALAAVPPSHRGRRLSASVRSGWQRFVELAAEVVSHEDVTTRRLLATMAVLPRLTPALGEALGVTGAAERLVALGRRGLFVEEVLHQAGWYRLGVLGRAFVVEHHPLEADERRDVLVTAASWYVGHGHPEEALVAAASSGDAEVLRSLLHEIGEDLVRTGRAQAVLTALDAVPDTRDDARLLELAGMALQMRGEFEDALRCYQRVTRGRRELPPRIAWRMGLIHYLRGDLQQALDVYGRGRTDGAADADLAMLLSWTATVHWIRSEAGTARRLATRSLDVANACGDPQALAGAHTVLAMMAALDGDRRANDAHYLRALEHARRADDVLQLIRVHTNRASHHTEEGAYPEALAELELAIELSDLSGFFAIRAVALSNRAETHLRLGHLEEAGADLVAARDILLRLESDMVSYPLTRLGALETLRGDAVSAEDAFRLALEHAERSGDVQALVPALAGRARLLADRDPQTARALADRAVACGQGMGYVEALLASAVVALAEGDGPRARRQARQAREVASARRDQPGVARSLELEAATAAPARATQLLDRAVGLWREIGDPIGRARAELARAGHLDEAAARRVAADVRHRMRAIGCRSLDVRATRLLERLEDSARPSVAIEVLGGFRVLRNGAPVPHNAWQSRKARDLLKILLTHRGRPVPRERLMEHLWPGEGAKAVANRLNVALATARGVLDPDRALSSDHYLVSDAGMVRIDLEHVDVDLERFSADAATGVRLHHAGRRDDARPRLQRAEAVYAGDVLEEDAYEQWAIPVREGTRAAYVEVAWLLAADAADAGDVDAASRYLLRILERDPFDERAHLRLVSLLSAAGRHGDARRHYRIYCERMDELEVEAEPFPR